MPSPASERLRPWIGSAALHVIFIGLLAGFAVKWRTDPPPPQLAIEGSVVRYEDLPPSVKSGKPLREEVPVPPPLPTPAQPEPEVRPEPQPEPEPKVEPKPQPDPALEQKRAAQAQARLAVERERAEQQKALAEQQRKAEAAKQQEALKRRQQVEEEQAAQEAKLKADREARLRSEREAELKRALASEEEGEAIQRSGVVDEYRTLLTQTIERNWIRPPSARAGLECTLDVTQATGGTVIDVKVGTCNGDQAVRESIANAVYRSSPLPAPRDPRAFSRKLVIVFKPTE
jgi:colicin import membrane protein